MLIGRALSVISIHALLAESDSRVKFAKHLQTDFYPRSPCGERQTPNIFRHCTTYLFLSTLSLRRATYDTYAKVLRVNISIHALLAESDLNLPSSPIDKNISIHALLAESDRVNEDRYGQQY